MSYNDISQGMIQPPKLLKARLGAAERALPSVPVGPHPTNRPIHPYQPPVQVGGARTLGGTQDQPAQPVGGTGRNPGASGPQPARKTVTEGGGRTGGLGR